MLSRQHRKKRLELSWVKKAETLLRLLFIVPLALFWNIAASSFRSFSKRKPWRRRLIEVTFQTMAAQAFSTAQLKYIEKRDTHATYTDWVEARNLVPQEDDIAHGAKILWIGNRRSEKVFFYCHGGGFLLPVQNFALDYWAGMLERLRRSGKDANIAMLAYSLSDIATFPTQLEQAVAGLKHILQLGYGPADIVLIGDSAGGNLIFQILLHILHPVPTIDHLGLPNKSSSLSKFAGALAVSPWLSLTSTAAGSYRENRDVDIITDAGLDDLGRVYLEGAPLSAYPYVDPASAASVTWFKDIGEVVDRVLITAGERESLRDDIIKVGKYVAENHPAGTTVIVQKGGLHADMFLDVPLNHSPPVKLTDDIYEWLRDVLR